MPSAIPAFYVAGRVNIWVEDLLTQAYLGAIWPTAPFHYLVAGGMEGAKAMAKRAADDHFPIHVFAIVDRDLGADNEAKWADPTWTYVVYRPRVLEIENFLLDEAALAQAAGNAKSMPEAEILRLFLERAERLKWWMTCKRTLSEINAIRNQEFPPDRGAHPDRPDKGVTTEDQAVALLRDCTWTGTTLLSITHELKDPQLRLRVRSAYADVIAWLAGDDWRERFSGKELYEWVHGQVCDGAKGTRGASREALAAEVGAIQALTGRVHPSLIALEASIRRRAGV